MASVAAEAVAPLIIRVVVDNAVDGVTRDLTTLIAALAAVSVAGFAAGVVRRYLGGRLSLDVQHDLRGGCHRRAAVRRRGRVPVDDDDTATDLFHKTIVLFAPITPEALALIGSGRTDWIKQDPAQATFFHKRSAEDSRIDWKLPATRIANLV
ncbi:MAG TPA: hypothetical protein VHZ33_10100, partial [Trebonia sp.]|nr:hypothetical protein [Trebonia sp.]